MHPVEIKRGNGPIILGMPHTGTFVPDDVLEKFNDRGRALADTDWHIDQLYDGVLSDLTIVRATFSRYVIDANRDPQGVSLYPGQNTTSLCPTTDFVGAPIYASGAEPSEDEVEQRRLSFHHPYHQAIENEIKRLKAKYTHIVLYDCHSIRSALPFLFEGTLPDLNLGTNEGTTCAPQIQHEAYQICARSGYSTVLNGRFKGGWTTRHYANPQNGVHAFQMETAQSVYLENEQAPWTYDAAKADKLRPVLSQILTMMNDFTLSKSAT